MKAPRGGIEITAVEVVPFMSQAKGGGYNFTLFTIEGFFFCLCTVFKVIWQSVYLSIPSETGCIKSDLYF